MICTLKALTILFAAVVCSAMSCLNAQATEILIDTMENDPASGIVFDDGTFTVERTVDGMLSNASGTGFDLTTLGASGVMGSVTYTTDGGSFGDIFRTIEPDGTAEGFRIGTTFVAFSGSLGDFVMDVSVDGAVVDSVMMSDVTTPYVFSDAGAGVDGASEIGFKLTSTGGGANATLGTTPPSGGFFVTGNAIPEPTSIMLFGAIAGVAGISRRRR